MLHAARIADSQGRVIVLVSPSGRGKKTEARARGAHAGYASDETIAIDDAGRVHPYRQSLSAAPLTLAAIVLLDRRPDADDLPTIEVCDLGDAIEDLVRQTSYLTELPTPLQAIARHVDATGGVRRVAYREESSLVDALAPLFEATPQPPRTSSPELIVHDTLDDAQGTPLYSRVPSLDALALADPDRLALLHTDAAGRGTVRVLAGIAPAIWRAASGAPLTALIAAVVDAHGAPPAGTAADAVTAAVDELAEAGVLTTERVWRIRDDVAWTDVQGRVVALSLAELRDPAPRALVGSGSIIWHALGERERVVESTVIERVAQAARVDADAVREDVRAFLRDLRDRLLVSAD